MNPVNVATDDFKGALDLFTNQLGFRLDRISPADSPTEADLSGYGMTLQLRSADIATGGSEDLLIPAADQSLVISRLGDSPQFGEGRAGMTYRDLIPNRQGGRFIASHIRIDAGGEVGDYPHFHNIRFQMIFCYRGWVEVVYQDQGDPFILEEGDCVLQPPGIRHRVLESSPGLEVIEIGCPAEHDTYADHEIDLPTEAVDPDRDFGGQRFVRHVAKSAAWTPWRLPGFEGRDFGFAPATDGLAEARVLRSTAPTDASVQACHDGEFLFWFVLAGSVAVEVDGATHELVSGDGIVIPAGESYSLAELEHTALLEVTLPATLPASQR